MKKFLVLSVFLIACGGEEANESADEQNLDVVFLEVEPDGCGANPEITPVETEKICIDSMRCVNKGMLSFSNYACFCDNLCLCFFSNLTNCSSIYEECESNGSMLIMPSDFCLYPNKDLLLKELNKSVKEMMDENITQGE